MENNRPLGWTTIEEAKLLVEAGLDPNTADMYYCARQRFDGNEYVSTGEWHLCHPCDKEKGYDGDDDFSGEEHFQYLLKTFGASKYDDDDDCFVPCWSIGALIDLMPSKLYTEIGYCYLSLYKDPMSFDRLSILFDHNLYRVAYDYEEGEYCEHKDYKSTEKDESLMSVIVEMVIWLIQNGYIKKHE